MESDQIVLDGLTNIVRGLGVRGVDPMKSTGVEYARIFSESELVNLYAGVGLVSRAVNVVAEDMVRNGWEIPEDNDGKLYKEQQRLKIKTKLCNAIKWSRLFGGSVVVIQTKGQRFTDELRPYNGQARKVLKLHEYSRYRVVLDEIDYDTDSSSETFGEYKYLTINPTKGLPFKVHTSRCLFFKGISLPETPYAVTDREGVASFWGMSVVQGPWDSLSNLIMCMKSSGIMATEAVVGKYTLPGLDELLKENDIAAIKTRMDVIELSKSVVKAVFLGEGEEYVRDQLDFKGLPDVMDRLFMMVSGEFGIPVTRLFGRSAAGSNATGDEDNRIYFDQIESGQELDLLNNLLYLLQAIDSGLGGVLGEDSISVEFNPAWAPSEAQYVEMKARQAAADQIYVDIGAVEAGEIRRIRFSGGYAFEQAIEGADKPLPRLQEVPIMAAAKRKYYERSKPRSTVPPQPDKVKKQGVL